MKKSEISGKRSILRAISDNGDIDFTEFILLKTLLQLSEKDLSMALKVFDTDQDGTFIISSCTHCFTVLAKVMCPRLS